MSRDRRSMCHVIGARCVARTIVPWSLERTCWRRFATQQGDCKKSQTAPLNAIIIISWMLSAPTIALPMRSVVM